MQLLYNNLFSLTNQWMLIYNSWKKIEIEIWNTEFEISPILMLFKSCQKYYSWLISHKTLNS